MRFDSAGLNVSEPTIRAMPFRPMFQVRSVMIVGEQRQFPHAILSGTSPIVLAKAACRG
jgi:hypothetical protein